MKTILIVDDEYDIASNLSMVLTMEGFETSTAYHGKDALALIEGGLKPDLIITDVMMPIMDGHELIKRLKANDELKNIPIILMSAAQMDTTKVSKTDVTTFLGKPFNLDKFIVAVNKVFAGNP